MRLVIQRVKDASVTAEGKPSGAIATGLLVLIGIEHRDTEEDVSWLTQKLVNMRIFPDPEGKMNRSLIDVNGGLLVVSQFTLFASTKKGNRPGFTQSAPPSTAIPLYENFIEQCRRFVPVETGRFGADMQISLINDGPVTILIDSKNRE